VAAAEPSVRVGETFAGYRIESLLGRGGMGAVYLATHERLNRRVALKVLVPELVDDESFRGRFIRESQLAASIDHPHIIPIYDADEVEGVLYIAMRYVDGPSLRGLIKERGHLSPERSLQIIGQVGGALDAAHKAGLVHRDVKPANILIADSGAHVYLCDFGLAKRTSSEGMTRTGSFLGTVDYCAPEQIEGKAVDGRTDIYSLGGVLFHCLAGQPPYVRETEVAVIQAHLADPPPALSSVRPDLPRAFDGVIVTAMAKYPEVRYSTAKELTKAFENALASPPETVAEQTVPLSPQPSAALPPPHTVAYPPPPASAVGATARSSAGAKWLIGALALGAMLIAAAAAVFVLRGSHSGPSSVNSRIAGIVKPLVPLQGRVNVSVASLSTAPGRVASLRGAASNLEQAALRAQGATGGLAAGGPVDRAAKSALAAALARQSSYAQALTNIPSASSISTSQAAALVSKATLVDRGYSALNSRTGTLCCLAMPRAGPAADRFLVIARANGPRTQLAAFVTRIENLLAQSANGRHEIKTALADGFSCSAFPGDAGRRIASVANNRQSILDQLGSLHTPTPQAADIVNLLQQAMIQSIEADRHYRDFFFYLQDQQLTSCPLPQTQDLTLAQQSDVRATAAKQTFATAFNPLARRVHQRTWSGGDF
jgi:serine/threonine protein kinase